MPAKQPRSDVRSADQWHGGFSDNLEPLASLDVTTADSCDALVRQMAQTSFAGRELGRAADVLSEMFSDEKCFVVMTLSGAMTMAKMGLMITEMIDQGLVDAIVSTGALMCHGVIEQTGGTHFRYDPKWTDAELYEAGYARVYDTLELERNLSAVEELVGKFLAQFPADQPFGSWEFHHQLGHYVSQRIEGRGILQSAAAKDIPVYVPAFTDSELGFNIYLQNELRRLRGEPPLRFDPLRDMDDYTNRCLRAERLGIFTIGGGVPRNWAQQVGPVAEVLSHKTDGKLGGLRRFRYAVRICPEPTHFGGLSGCTYSEGISWGKFVPPAEGGRFAEVYGDATLAWPLLMRAVLERLGRV